MDEVILCFCLVGNPTTASIVTESKVLKYAIVHSLNIFYELAIKKEIDILKLETHLLEDIITKK